jgi:Flp pilus assembly protein TadD
MQGNEMTSGFARVRRLVQLLSVVAAAAALGACSALEKAGFGEVALTTGSTGVEASAPPPVSKPLDEVKDDITLGKEHYRAGNYGLAEMHFRRAVETSPGNAEAWLGLAAAYDQLKRFALADRAYREVLKLTGATPELLNNRGYSYLLRGDLGHASQDLAAAAAKAPDNERIQNNLKILDGKARRRV